MFTPSFPYLILLHLLLEPPFLKEYITPPPAFISSLCMWPTYKDTSPSRSLFSGVRAAYLWLHSLLLKKMTLLMVSSLSGEPSGVSFHLWWNVHGPNLMQVLWVPYYLFYHTLKLQNSNQYDNLTHTSEYTGSYCEILTLHDMEAR